MKLSIFCETEMGLEITGITIYGPRDVSLGPALSLTKLSLGPAMGRCKLFRSTSMGPINLFGVFKSRTTHRIAASAPDKLFNSRGYKPTELRN